MEQLSLNNMHLKGRSLDWLLPEGSPYKGLSLQEQQGLAKKMRGSGRPPKEWLKKLRSVTKEDYRSLVLQATNALVNKTSSDGSTGRYERIKVVVKLPFNFRRTYDKSLPRGRAVAYETFATYVEFKAQYLLDWLHKKGYSEYNSKTLQQSLWSFNAYEQMIERYNGMATDSSIVELYENILGEAK